MQRDDPSISTIEKELETAIFKAGGIRDSNFGNQNKIAWARSSRTDKGVHSLATMISLKMEIPENTWDGDPYGIALVNHINSYLPHNIKVFSVLPSQRENILFITIQYDLNTGRNILERNHLFMAMCQEQKDQLVRHQSPSLREVMRKIILMEKILQKLSYLAKVLYCLTMGMKTY